MENSFPQNLLEVDTFIESFLENNNQGIVTLHRTHLHNDDELSIRACIVEMLDELKTGCVTFLNKEYPIEEINAYLFYIANDFFKKRAAQQVKKSTNYLCPGCLFLGKETTILHLNKIFKCDECDNELKKSTDPKNVAFFRTFFKHNKNGYHCQDCDRFIPHPLDNSPIVSCPYFDCCFVGSWSSLKRMHHPNSQSNAEMLTLDSATDSNTSFKNLIPSDSDNAQVQLEAKEDLDQKILLLREVIDSQLNSVPYSSSDFTVKHKCLIYQSFDNLLKEYPVEMVDYLLNQSRSGGFQHKVFQEYIRLLEEAIPYSFKKGNKVYKIESLLDPNLGLFDGISVFNSIITDKLTIKNGTKEFYIGGRKAKITKPYYIGKILNIIDEKTREPLLNQIVEYSFSLIKMKEVKPGTKVIVTHLRVPPHYQMGGMVHINRIRKKIVDRAHLLLEKEE